MKINENLCLSWNVGPQRLQKDLVDQPRETCCVVHGYGEVGSNQGKKVLEV